MKHKKWGIHFKNLAVLVLSRLAGTVLREHVGCNPLSAEALCSMQTVKNKLKPGSDFHRRTFRHIRGITLEKKCVSFLNREK